MSASWQGLLQNLAILAILVSVWTHGLNRIEGKTRLLREAFGAVLATAGVILLMTFPFEIQPGVITDLRGTLIGLAGFMGSPLIGLATALAAAAYRAELGGAGTAGGLLAITVAAVIGIGGHVALRGRVATTRDIVVFAVVSAVFSISGFFLLPYQILLPTLVQIGPPIIIMTFVAIMVAGLAVAESDRRREAARINLFYRSIIDALPEPLNAKGKSGRFLAANPATARLMKAADVATLIGKTDFDFYPKDVARRFREDEERLLTTGEVETIEQEITREDGSRVWLSTLKSPFRDNSGAIIGLITHNRDITERKRMENEIAEGRRRLSYALENMADGLVMFDRERRIVLCNDQFRAMFPMTADLRVPGARFEDILRAAVARGEQADIPKDRVDNWIRQAIADLAEPSDRAFALADGRWLTARARPTEDGGALLVLADITELKRAETVLTELNRRLADLAVEDALTGLTNRRGYDEALKREFARSTRSGAPLSLLLVDVDRFKAYNDTYGHPTGDECLRQVGRLLKRVVQRPSDVAARYGGEEFAAILPDTLADGALRLAEMLRGAVRDLALKHTGSEKGVVTVSIGVATTAPGGVIGRREDLEREADAALYAAKAAGRDRVIVAEPGQKLAASA